MISHRSLIMIFSDLLGDTKEALAALRLLRFSGHDVIVFHILDEAEVSFHFREMFCSQIQKADNRCLWMQMSWDSNIEMR